jgi:DNA-binding MarR family transcriptional regulator
VSTAVLEKQAEPLANQVTTGLIKIGLAVKSRTRREAGAHRISPTQGQILAFLQSRHGRPTTLSAIAREMALTSATASEAVRALEKKGLVRKVRGAIDARSVFITLSAKGRRKAAQTAAWSDFLTVAVETLTPAEREAILRTLTKVVQALPPSDKE